MKASELRIGNLFMFGELIHTATHWDIRNLRVAELKGKPLEVYKPIPLTEEWFDKLEDMGWEFVGFGTRIIYQHTIFKAIKVELGGYDQVAIYFNNELLCFKEHLHGLQNLYHALTGEDLTFIDVKDNSSIKDGLKKHEKGFYELHDGDHLIKFIKFNNGDYASGIHPPHYALFDKKHMHIGECEVIDAKNGVAECKLTIYTSKL